MTTNKEVFLSLVSPEEPVPFKKRKCHKKLRFIGFLKRMGFLPMYVRIELLKIRIKEYFSLAV